MRVISWKLSTFLWWMVVERWREVKETCVMLCQDTYRYKKLLVFVTKMTPLSFVIPFLFIDQFGLMSVGYPFIFKFGLIFLSTFSFYVSTTSFSCLFVPLKINSSHSPASYRDPKPKYQKPMNTGNLCVVSEFWLIISQLLVKDKDKDLLHFQTLWVILIIKGT